MRVWVNEDSCLSHWACEIAPAVFVNMGKSHPVVPPDVTRFFESERGRIIDAVMRCPTASLFLEFEDGRVVSSQDYDASRGLQEWLDY
jgi:ferredoxin